MMRAIGILIGVIAVMVSTMGFAATTQGQALVVDGVTMRTKIAGSGTPAVIFEAGLGDGRDSFGKQFKALAADATVFAYDRPGYGSKGVFLADSDGKRTGQEVARHLHAVLQQSGVSPPYVLVGHSIGGLYMLNFAALYPDEVAGIVLVDSRPAGFTKRCQSSKSGLCDAPGFVVGLFPKHQKAEFRGADEAELTAASPQALGNIPVTVISANVKPELSAGQYQPIWESMQRDFAASAQNGRFVLAKGSTHYVHQKQPKLVTDEVRLIVTKARENGR